MGPFGTTPSASHQTDLDPLGPAIERGLDAGIRHREGQHFTRPDVADLVAAFCIRGAEDRVLDPACGTGGFLLRARARLRLLAGGAGRGLEARLAGIESDPRLARAARRSLPGATIVRADFLAHDTGATDPPRLFDAVVGNPPYVRQELISRSRKAALTRGAGLPFPISRRCDLHVHFWPRAMARLREGGRLGFLTSNTWLDAEYGAPLRRWLQERCTLVALIESEAESWFDDARVRTVIVIVENRPPGGGSPTRLVRLPMRLDEMVPRDLPAGDRLAAFAEIARGIESASGPDPRIRARSLPRGAPPGDPWGPPLRMPDLHFEIVSRAADRLAPLEQLAEVSWGIKTGDDAVFFHPRDGEPSVEARFLVPAVFNLMELDHVIVTLDQIRRRLLLVDLRDEAGAWRRGAPRLARFIRQAERSRATHLRPTCAAREGRPRGRRWFELRPGAPGDLLWSIMHQYRHLVPWNPERFHSNDNLLRIRARAGIEPRLLAAILNSHVQALVKHAHGRHRNEGMLKTQAADVRRMPVPDPRRIAPRAAARILEAFHAVAARRVGRIPEECALPDRRELDLATLAAIGWREPEAGAAVDRLYAALIGSCRSERRWELDAVARRRRGPIRREARR